jgi:hypothetical protein
VIRVRVGEDREVQPIDVLVLEEGDDEAGACISAARYASAVHERVVPA